MFYKSPHAIIPLSDPHKNCRTLNRLVAKLTVGISQTDNCSAKIFIGCYLELKLNLANTQGKIKILP